jgi:anaerobic magnesium-protoporphyrin IX monomethyl ester cyclase
MNKKLILLSPPYQYKNKSLKWVAKSITVAPPLGLLYVAEAAKSVSWSVEIVDSEMEEYSLETAINKIILAAPDLIGITVTTPFLQSAIQASQGVKKLANIPVIIGGAHPTAKGQETLLDCFDFALQGEGDEAFKHFLNAFEGKGRYSDVAGLIYRENGEILSNASEQLENLNQLGVPERGLLNLKKYISRVPNHGTKRYTSIMATRGCPYECVFCAVQTMYGRTLRFRPVEDVIEEIKICIKNYDITHFHFVDDTLTVNKNYVRKLCQAIHDNHLDITWEGWTRADCIDETHLDDECGFCAYQLWC